MKTTIIIWIIHRRLHAYTIYILYNRVPFNWKFETNVRCTEILFYILAGRFTHISISCERCQRLTKPIFKFSTDHFRAYAVVHSVTRSSSPLRHRRRRLINQRIGLSNNPIFQYRYRRYDTFIIARTANKLV